MVAKIDIKKVEEILKSNNIIINPSIRRQSRFENMYYSAMGLGCPMKERELIKEEYEINKEKIQEACDASIAAGKMVLDKIMNLFPEEERKNLSMHCPSNSSEYFCIVNKDNKLVFDIDLRNNLPSYQPYLSVEHFFNSLKKPPLRKGYSVINYDDVIMMEDEFERVLLNKSYFTK